MLITRFRTLLTTPRATGTSLATSLWALASLGVCAFYAYLATRGGFADPYVVEDDVRQHVFWMQRFLDPGLFPGDLIADYFQSVEPAGFIVLYRTMAAIGIEPILLSKLLPMVLGLAATAYCFALSMKLLPVPFAAFTASLLLNQVIWQRLDISSATPRAFLYPFFLGFLVYFTRRSTIGCLVMIALCGLFYPPMLFIVSGVLVLSLLRWERGRPRLTSEGSSYRLSLTGLAVVLVVLLAFALKSSQFGSTVTFDEARMLPHELAGRRLSLLSADLAESFLWDGQGGLLARMYPLPVALAAGILLPLLMRYNGRFPLARWIDPAIRVLPMIALVSALMFLAAHAVLFRLYLPNRYTQHSFFILMPLAAGPAITILLDAFLQWTETLKKVRGLVVAVGAVVLLGALLFSYPLVVQRFPRTKWIIGQQIALYEFLLKQPKDTLIASLSVEANNLPTFSKRPVLVAQEYANPFHATYYLELNRRYLDLLDAQYTADQKDVQDFVGKYGVDLFVLDRKAFTPKYPIRQRVVKLFKPIAKEIKGRLKQGQQPVLLKRLKDCTVLETDKLIVLDAKCVSEADQN